METRLKEMGTPLDTADMIDVSTLQINTRCLCINTYT